MAHHAKEAKFITLRRCGSSRLGATAATKSTLPHPVTLQVVGGKDLSARVFSLNPIEGYRPPTLAGHREPIVAGALQQHRFVAWLWVLLPQGFNVGCWLGEVCSRPTTTMPHSVPACS